MQHRILSLAAVFLFPLFLVPVGYAQDAPIPAINPLGDLSAYSSVELIKNSFMEVLIPEDDGVRAQEIKGDVWRLDLDGGGDQEEIRQQLRAYGESIGAEFLRWTPEAALLRKKMDNGEVWWCKAQLEYGMQLAVVQTLRVVPDQPVSFAMGEHGRDEAHFFMDNPGGKFRSLAVSVDQGEYTLVAELHMRAGAYQRSVYGKWDLDGGKANRFSVDAIPQESGTCTFSLSTNPGSPAATVTVELKEYPYPIPKVEFGEKLGALRIKNIPYGLARIKRDNRFCRVEIQHPEFPTGSGFENGDVTPQGDAYFLMPAGLWQVEVTPTEPYTASAVRTR